MESRHRWMRFVTTRWILAIATLGPVGRIRKAPGTWGSAAGMLWYALVFHYLPWPIYLILLGVTGVIAVEITHEAEVRLKQRDPGSVVLDEFVAVPLCFFQMGDAIAATGGWPLLLTGFVLFRLFDIWKPYPVSRLQDVPGGPGVVLDDVAAAAITCLLLQLAAARLV